MKCSRHLNGMPFILSLRQDGFELWTVEFLVNLPGNKRSPFYKVYLCLHYFTMSLYSINISKDKLFINNYLDNPLLEEILWETWLFVGYLLYLVFCEIQKRKAFILFKIQMGKHIHISSDILGWFLTVVCYK